MRKTLAIIFCTALLMGIASGQQSQSTDGTSLADVARHKKTKPTTKHVITNEDIPARAGDSAGSSGGGTGSGSGSASSASAAPGSGAPAADAKAGDAKDPKDDGAKKPANAEALSTAQTKVDNLKHDEEAMTNGVKKLEDMIAGGSDFRKNMLSDTLQHQKDNLAETQKKRAAAEAELDKLKNPKKP
jgi:hypothetical protein